MMSTIKNIHVSKDFSENYDFLIMGVQDGLNKIPLNNSFSDLSNQSIQIVLKGEKKFVPHLNHEHSDWDYFHMNNLPVPMDSYVEETIEKLND